MDEIHRLPRDMQYEDARETILRKIVRRIKSLLSRTN